MKVIYRKILTLLVSLFLTASLLLGCGPKKEVNSNQQPTQGTVSPASTENTNKAPASTAPVSRLSEILDSKKYADKFTVRMFSITHQDKDGKTSSGDAILVRTPDGATMLIDTGYKEEITGIIDQMKKLGITKLDYLVATHMHTDHVGGVPAVINAFPVGKVLASKYMNNDLTSTAKGFVNALQQKDIKPDIIKEGDTFQLGKDVKVEVLNPEDRDDIIFADDSYSDQVLTNDMSVVLKMTYGNNTFLFTGDIQIGTEQRLVEKYGDKLKADLLKGPHHGYATSSGSMFLRAVKPADIIVDQALMVNGDVHNRYKSVGSKVYVTGMDGNILAVSDGKSVTLVTEQDRKPGAIKP